MTKYKCFFQSVLSQKFVVKKPKKNKKECKVLCQVYQFHIPLKCAKTLLPFTLNLICNFSFFILTIGY